MDDDGDDEIIILADFLKIEESSKNMANPTKKQKYIKTVLLSELIRFSSIF